ncbi:MAG: type II toxin-antitoxin system VapB family antitoxin, partial [Candidatus Sumerlaeota bacterium]
LTARVHRPAREKGKGLIARPSKILLKFNHQAEVAMTLTIENPRAYELAKRLSEITGESVDEVVTQSIKERLDRFLKATLTEELLQIGRECAAKIKEPMKSTDHGDFLYDENGLPK